MSCTIKLPNNKYHALIAFLHGDEIVFGEPQTGKIKTYTGDVKIIRLIA